MQHLANKFILILFTNINNIIKSHIYAHTQINMTRSLCFLFMDPMHASLQDLRLLFTLHTHTPIYILIKLIILEFLISLDHLLQKSKTLHILACADIPNYSCYLFVVVTYLVLLTLHALQILHDQVCLLDQFLYCLCGQAVCFEFVGSQQVIYCIFW